MLGAAPRRATPPLLVDGRKGFVKKFIDESLPVYFLSQFLWRQSFHPLLNRRIYDIDVEGGREKLNRDAEERKGKKKTKEHTITDAPGQILSFVSPLARSLRRFLRCSFFLLFSSRNVIGQGNTRSWVLVNRPVRWNRSFYPLSGYRWLSVKNDSSSRIAHPIRLLKYSKYRAQVTLMYREHFARAPRWPVSTAPLLFVIGHRKSPPARASTLKIARRILDY